MNAGVIGQYAVAGQCDILLLPLFVKGVPTALQQDALMEVTKPKNEKLLLMPHLFISHIFVPQ